MYGQIYSYGYQDVFKRLNQLDVWSDIIGKQISVGQLVTSPFRFDQHAHCIVTEYNGAIYITDFAYPMYNKYTCVHAVAHIKNVSLTTAASMICNKFLHKLDINLSSVYDVSVSNIIKKQNKGKEIHFTPFTHQGKSCFTELDKQYWLKGGITKAQLNKHNVYSIHHYYIGDTYISPKLPTYAYYFPDVGRVKIYSPYEKDKTRKWAGTTTIEDIWQSLNGSNTCIITKSLKDLMVLENILPDVDIIAPQNEGCYFKYDFSQYTRILCLYDNDFVGRRASTIQCNRFGATSIFIPEELGKDTFELYAKHGKDICTNTILNLL